MSRLIYILFAVLLVAKVSAQGDFAWSIEPLLGSPSINFDEAHKDQEVIFEYTVGGNETLTKYLTGSIFQSDCATELSGTTKSVTIPSESQLLLTKTVHVDINQDLISADTDVYTANGDTASVQFCVKMEYWYIDGSAQLILMNFHETVVDIT